MDHARRHNNRMLSYMGQRTLDNPLKIFYEEVITNMTRQYPSAELQNNLDLRRNRFKSQGSQILEKFQNKEKPSRTASSIEQYSVYPKQSQKKQQNQTKYHQPYSKALQMPNLHEHTNIKKMQSQLLQKIDQKQKFTNGFSAVYQNYNKILLNNVKKQKKFYQREPNPNIQNYLKQSIRIQKPYTERHQNHLPFKRSQRSSVPENISSIHPITREKFSISEQRIQQNQLKQSPVLKTSTRRSFRKTFRPKEIVFLKPVSTRKEEVRKKLRKYMLAVYWLCCETKLIRDKINQRRSKHTILFNSISKHIYEYISSLSSSIFQPVITKIKSFHNQQATSQYSKSFLLHLIQVQKTLLAVLQIFKEVILKDKYTRSILRILIKEREHFPDGYLTEFQLNRIQVSKVFLYPVKSFSTCVILLMTFIFVRLLVVNIFSNPLRLDPDIFENPVWRKTIQEVRGCLYISTIQIIEQEANQGQFFDQKGNWKKIKKSLRYKPSKPLLCQQGQKQNTELVKHDWSMKGVEIFKNKLPNNWQLLKDSFKQWIYQLYDQLQKKEENTETLTLASRISKRTRTKK